MQKRGTTVDTWHPAPYEKVQRRTITADDPASEVTLCARWVRSLLAHNPTAKIGIVAPQLEVYQNLVERLFLAELEPDAMVAGTEGSGLFNLSLGKGLEREGVVHAALKLLRFTMVINQDDISWLLCTPYLGQADEERLKRAQADRELRRLRCFEWTFPHLLRTLDFLKNKYSISIPDFTEKISLITKDLHKSSRHLPGFWSEEFAEFLYKLGWPGERGLSSREFQAVEHFHKVLAELASLDGVSKPLNRSSVLSILTRLTSDKEFQPQGTDGPVQVLGALESSGMTFDHIWILGMHDTALPRTPNPNPFIPLPVQRRYQLRRSTAEREYQFAGQVAARLLSAAPDVICSWPVRDKGVEQRLSPFLKGIPVSTLPLTESMAPDQVLRENRPALEKVLDSQGPALVTRKPFSGGTGIIKDQALCPFRAFAHHRLKAERLDTPDIGIDAISRGSLVHTVLERFWEKILDQDGLLALDEQA